MINQRSNIKFSLAKFNVCLKFNVFNITELRVYYENYCEILGIWNYRQLLRNQNLQQYILPCSQLVFV